MPSFGPIKHADLIRCLRKAGFDGPYSGGEHQLMIRGNLTLRVPNPHRGDVGKELLSRVLRQAGISRDDWEKL